MSFPTRERGLKSSLVYTTLPLKLVVPHEGTWIEIAQCAAAEFVNLVVPHEGTWIEISMIVSAAIAIGRRSPRGNVD